MVVKSARVQVGVQLLSQREVKYESDPDSVDKGGTVGFQTICFV